MLHVHLLAAPDFLGFDSAIEMAQKGFKPQVERGLRLKRIGNDLMAAIGGREIHPVSPMVGGFSRAATKNELRAFEGRLEDALAEILEVADFVAPLERPEFPRDAELVSMVDATRYPIITGDMASTRGRAWTAETYEQVTEEVHVAHSNALHSVFTDTGTPYFVGPLARYNLNESTLPPVAREAAARAGLTSVPNLDPFVSMAARVAETAFAIEESLRLIRAYEPPDPPHVEVRPRAGRATWTTEAPRGTLYHRYDVDEDGTILEAKIVPPTSQNLRHMEHDLREFLPGVLDRSDEELTAWPRWSCGTTTRASRARRTSSGSTSSAGEVVTVTAQVRVIGCGNPEAGDDAVGLLAVGLARRRLPPEVEVVEAGLALKVLDLLEGVDAVVIADAVRAPSGGREPGAIVRAVGDPDGLPAELRGALSSHGLGLAEAVGLAAAMGPLPRVVFLGVEVGDLTAGHGLSAAVAAALPALVDAVVEEVAALAESPV